MGASPMVVRREGAMIASFIVVAILLFGFCLLASWGGGCLVFVYQSMCDYGENRQVDCFTSLMSCFVNLRVVFVLSKREILFYLYTHPVNLLITKSCSTPH